MPSEAKQMWVVIYNTADKFLNSQGINQCAARNATTMVRFRKPADIVALARISGTWSNNGTSCLPDSSEGWWLLQGKVSPPEWQWPDGVNQSTQTDWTGVSAFPPWTSSNSTKCLYFDSSAEVQVQMDDCSKESSKHQYACFVSISAPPPPHPPLLGALVLVP